MVLLVLLSIVVCNTTHMHQYDAVTIMQVSSLTRCFPETRGGCSGFTFGILWHSSAWYCQRMPWLLVMASSRV